MRFFYVFFLQMLQSFKKSGLVACNPFFLIIYHLSCTLTKVGLFFDFSKITPLTTPLIDITKKDKPHHMAETKMET